MRAPFSGRWRILWRFLLGLVVLLILIVVAAEIVFQTDLPRNLVITAVEKQTGLRFTANSLSTGFMGHTTLHDVTISLPLAEKPFLQISQMSIDHSWLPALLFGSFQIDRVDLDSPNLELCQGSDKTWNFQQVAQLLTPQNPGSSDNGSLPLPIVEIKNATVVVSDGKNRSATIEHLQFDGHPRGALLWECLAQVPGHVDIKGKIATGRLWAHEIDFQFTDLKSWIAPWVASWPESAKLEGQWSGRVDSGKLQGQLTLSQAGFSALSLTGPIQFMTTADGAQLQPAGAIFRDANAPSLDTQFTSGTINITSTGVEAKNLYLRFPRGTATVDAGYLLADSTASLHAAWHDLAIPSTATHSGDFQLNFTDAGGQPRFNATLLCHGSIESGNWDSDIDFKGGGDLRTLDATLTTQKLLVNSAHGKTLNLTGFVAHVGATRDGLVLHDLQLANSDALSGVGGYSFSKKVAWFALDGRDLPVPGHASRTGDFDVDIWSSPDRIHLSQLYVSTGLVSVDFDGEYVFNLPKPVQGHLSIAENPALGDSEDEEAGLASAGSFQSDIDITGTLAPLELAFAGTANGSDLHYHDRSFGDLSVDLAGTVQNGQVSLSSQNIQLLGGAWTVSGTWPVRNSPFRIDNLSVQHLSLPLATGDPDIAGSLDGNWAIDVRDLSLPGVSIDGSASLQDVAIHNNPNLQADRIDLPKIRISDGWVRSGPINLARGNGIARFRVVTAIENPTRLWVNGESKNWPVLPPAAKLPVVDEDSEAVASTQSSEPRYEGLLTTKSKLEVDLASKSAIGNVDFNLEGLLNSKSVATAQTAIEIDRRKLRFNNIKINTHGTLATGSASVDIDNPFQSHATLLWDPIDLGQFAADSPNFKDLSGKVGGSLQISPATQPRPLGPLAIDLQMKSHAVKFKTAELGDFQANGFLGPDRFVLNDTPDHPTQLAIAGGFIHFWGRATKHQGDVYQTLLGMNLYNLDLNTVLPAGAKTGETPGSLSGQITVVGEPPHVNLAFGQGSLRLEKSDLAGAGPIAYMYNLLHIFHDPKKPQGYGRIDFSIQGHNALITSMRYFDRGSEIRLSGTMDDLLQLPHSPINLVAIGSARPLVSINIPGIADIDQALNAVQSNALVVHIGGWLDKPTENLMSLSEVGQELKNLLFGGSANGTGD